jgi:hypothetical protein
MSLERVCAALALPPDPWPPDHYALLGLPRGPVEAERVEAHVLDRMERLRRYQLAHPDAVTDAMNRLAQALVCLTDPEAKRAYDAALGLVEPTPTTAAPPPPVPPPPALAPAIPPEAARRTAYRRRAVLRRLRAAWDGAGRFLADADRAFATRIELVELTQHLGTIRSQTTEEATPLTGVSGQPGSLTIGLARQPLLATTLYNLSPTYRRGLAGDWAAGTRRLDDAEQGLRQELSPGLRRWRRRLRRAALAALVDHLDVTIVLAGLAALAVAIARSRG